MIEDRSATAVLVPLKSFGAAKERLSDALDVDARSGLMRKLAAGVLKSSAEFSRWVVCDDVAVAHFALANGAQVIWRGGGLNGAVQAAIDVLGMEGFARVIVTHGDIANPGSFTPFDRPDRSFIIGSDRHGDGSNVVSVPTRTGFNFAYGPGSLDRHIAEAERCGLAVVRADDPTLQLDVDTPEDLALYRGDR